MGFHEILAQIDREIRQLQQARDLLGAPRASAYAIPRKKRNLTPEGRRRIAEAVKRRWELERTTKPAETALGRITESHPPATLAYQSARL